MIHQEDISRIRKEFKESMDSDVCIDDDLRTLVFLYLLNESKTQDTLDLFEIVPIESFVKVVKFFNGRRARFINTNMLDEVFKTTILYNEIENHKMSWKEVIARYPDWKIDGNKDRVRIARMKRILQENANKAIHKR